MSKQPQDGVDKLAALLPGGAPSEEPQGRPEPLTEEQVAEKMKNILQLLSGEADEDIFLMQDLLEACSTEVQGQIKEMFFEDPEDTDGQQ